MEKTNKKDSIEEKTPLSPSLLKRAKHNINILRQFKQGDFSDATSYTEFGGLPKALKDDAIKTELASFLTEDDIYTRRHSRCEIYIPNGNEDANLGSSQGLKIVINPGANKVPVILNVIKKVQYTVGEISKLRIVPIISYLFMQYFPQSLNGVQVR